MSNMDRGLLAEEADDVEDEPDRDWPADEGGGGGFA